MDKLIRKYIFVYNFFSLITIFAVVYIGGLDIITGIFTYGSLMIFVNDYFWYKKVFFDIAISYADKINKSYVSFVKILNFNDNFSQEEDTGKLDLKNYKYRNSKFKFLI